MIYEYEANILNLVNAIIPQIKVATYASDDNVFELMRAVTKFPAFYYQRKNANWSFNKRMTVKDLSDNNSEKAVFVPYEQTYEGKILVENQGQAIKVASAMRFGIGKHPYITVHFPTKEEEVDVQVRLTAIGIGEERGQENDKGALRYVSIEWKSQLFMCDYTDNLSEGLVEKINIWLNPNNLTEAQIYNEQGVFVSIPLTPINI